MYDAAEVWSDWIRIYNLDVVTMQSSTFFNDFATMYKCPSCGALFTMDYDVDVHTMWIDRLVWDSDNPLERDACDCDLLRGTWDLETLETV